MIACRIVEAGPATHRQMHIASDHRHPSDDLIRLFTVLFNRHVVRQLDDAFFGKKARKQDICLRQIELTDPHVREIVSNFKAAAALIVEERGKNRWRIEIRIAQEIDRAVHADQRDRLHIPDYAVIFYGFKSHVIRYAGTIDGCRSEVALTFYRAHFKGTRLNSTPVRNEISEFGIIRSGLFASTP